MPSSDANVDSASNEQTVAALRRFAQRRPQAQACEFCSEALPVEHRHVLESGTRNIVCACTPCALRFENVIGHWKLIPRDPKRLSGFQMTDLQWNGLAVPINLVFIFRSTPGNKLLALYPSPGGATESLLQASDWESLVSDNPVLGEMQPEVEALLINRLKDVREYYLAPIDRCFELVGRIRLNWRGFSGGDRVWEEIEEFFVHLRGDSTEQSSDLPHA